MESEYYYASNRGGAAPGDATPERIDLEEEDIDYCSDDGTPSESSSSEQ